MDVPGPREHGGSPVSGLGPLPRTFASGRVKRPRVTVTLCGKRRVS